MNHYIKALSAAGLIFIALHEGFSGKPYLDSVGVLTNGFGNTNNAKQTVTVPQALEQLGDNTKTAESAVIACITRQTNQNQFDAFVSLTFNIGNNAFCKSTLVRKFNSGDSVGACEQILRWDYAGGKRLSGLTKRRAAEYELCMRGN